MDNIIPLTPAEIHVWLSYYEEGADERLYSACRELLNAEEKEQELRFHFPRDRRRYLITRALVRTVLSRYIPVDPREWIFSTNAYGRPGIVNAEARNACLSFNISHTHSLIVLGVTKGRDLGVDVENVCGREVSMDIADYYFTPHEVESIHATPPLQRQYRFFEFWTFKEAYIKARGMGLCLPLDKFSFHYPSEHSVEIAIDPELGDDAGRWQFWQIRPRPEYLVAICAEQVGARSPTLIVREACPMWSEKILPLQFLRASSQVSTIDNG